MARKSEKQQVEVEIKGEEVEVPIVTEETRVEPEKISVDNSFGPSKFCRDGNGLLSSVQYIFNEDGSVNWRKMIKDEHLYVNKDRFKDGEVPDSVEGLDDSKLLIKLSGIKEIAKLRGFRNVNFRAIKADLDHAVVICDIDWIPNYESANINSVYPQDSVTYSEIGNATLENCDGFSAKFLECIAANRAFIRCVRNYLGIHIVGADEIDKSGRKPLEPEEVSANIKPSDVLRRNAKAKGYSDYEQFKEFLRDKWKAGEYVNEEVKTWKDFSDIPPKDARILLALINQG